MGPRKNGKTCNIPDAHLCQRHVPKQHTALQPRCASATHCLCHLVSQIIMFGRQASWRHDVVKVLTPIFAHKHKHKHHHSWKRLVVICLLFAYVTLVGSVSFVPQSFGDGLSIFLQRWCRSLNDDSSGFFYQGFSPVFQTFGLCWRDAIFKCCRQCRKNHSMNFSTLFTTSDCSITSATWQKHLEQSCLKQRSFNQNPQILGWDARL